MYNKSITIINMSYSQENIQNYFNQSTIVQIPTPNDIENLNTLVVRLSPNQYLDADYLKTMFETSLQYGVVEKIQQIVNMRNEEDYQYVYIITFNCIKRDGKLFIDLCNNLLFSGYCDMCLLFESYSISIRVFYDKIIQNELHQIVQYSEKKHSLNVLAFDNMQTLFDSKIEKIYADMKSNYEQFESITESDIDLLDEKHTVLNKELEDTKRELSETKKDLADLKDQIKWMNKIFYQKVKESEANIRDDFINFKYRNKRKI